MAGGRSLLTCIGESGKMRMIFCGVYRLMKDDMDAVKQQKNRARKILREAAVVLACGLVYLFWVARTGIGFPCVFRLVTGWKCPGCGITHAAVHLARGNFRAAWADNPLVITLFPFLLPYLVWKLVRYVRTGTDTFRPAEIVYLGLMLAAAVGFGIYRNLNSDMVGIRSMVMNLLP